MAHQPKAYKKFVASAATATLVATALVPAASAAEAKSFTDVSKNYKEAVDYLVANGITQGISDTKFGTGMNIKRGDAAVFIAKALNLDTANAKNQGFVDVNARVKAAVNAVVEAGIANGKSESKFAPDDLITRQEMAKMLSNAYGLTADKNANFKDVNSNWIGYVSALKEAGITLGKTETTFAPTAPLTRGEFALFMFRAEGQDSGVVIPGAASVKVINNTTVEVTFKEAIEDIKSHNFAIEGLTVENAVVKQTDAKTAVLTTSAQEGDKVYTVHVDSKKVGTFKGVSAVLPTKVAFTTQSQQGVYGQQVTVSAQVTVADGQSKAGIPVTFNVDSNKDAAGGQFAKDYTAESLTDANGVATYTYTQYNPTNSEDSVTAYATGKANVRAFATVYWGNAARLSVTEVTTTATTANSSSKVYQVKSTENRNGFVFVTFKENQGVTPDKVTNGVTFTDANVYSVDANGNFSAPITNGVPFEVTTGGHQVAVVKLNAEGVGNFTLTGADATVTPIVYDGTYDALVAGNISVSKDAKYDGTDLQAVANPAVFSLSQVADMTIVAEGKANAAARNADSSYATAGVGTGGRDYKITLKGKDGKIAPANTNVVVYFEQGSTGNSNRVNHAVTLVNGDNSYTVAAQPTGSTNLSSGITLKTNSKGEIEFSVHGANNDFVTPIAVYDNGKTAGVLDTSDLKVVGETTYFGVAELGGSRIDILDETGKVVTDSTVTSNVAAIRYVAIDQNGFNYYNNSSKEFDATFVLSDAFTVYSTDAVVVSKENNRTTYKVKATNGVATLNVTKTSTGSGQVSYTASTTNNIVAPQSGVVKFGTAADRAIITGKVTVFDTTKNEVTIMPTNSTLPVTLSYAGADWFYKGSAAGVTESYFESKLAVGVEITYNKATETAKAKFDITKDAAGDVVDSVNASVNAAQVKQALLAGNYPGYATLPTVIQNDVAARLFALNTIHASQAALDVAYETALDASVTSAIGTADAAAGFAGAAVAGPAFTTAYTAFVDAVRNVPGSSTVVANLLALDNDALKDTVATAVGALTPDTTKTAAEDAAAYVASIQAEIDRAKAAASQQPTTDALGAINAAGVNSGPTLLAALNANNTSDTSKTNAEVLGLDLSVIPAADLNDVIASLYTSKPAVGFNKLNISGLLSNAIALETGAPTVASAVYDKSDEELVITFSRVVTDGADTIDVADITLAGTVALTNQTAVLATANGVTTLTISIADNTGVLAASTVTALTVKDAPTVVTLVDTANTPNAYVFTNFNYTIQD